MFSYLPHVNTTGKRRLVNAVVKYLDIYFSRNENFKCYSILK